MRFLKNLNIRAKLFLVIISLLIPLIYFVQNGIRQQINERNNIEYVNLRLQEIEKLSLLIHNMQRERAVSQGFLLSDGEKFINRLQNQRRDTDNALRSYEEFLRDQNLPGQNLDFITNLTIQRKEIDNRTADRERSDVFFLELIENLRTRVQLSIYVDNDQIRQLVQAQTELILAKQYLGRIRTVLIQSFTKGTYNAYDFATLNTQRKFFDYHLENFFSSAGQHYTDLFLSVTRGEDTDRLNSLIRNMSTNPEYIIANYEPIAWHDLISAYVDRFREVEIQLLSEILQINAIEIQRKNEVLTFYFSFVLTIVAIVIILAIFIIKYISDSIYQVKNAADLLSVGDTNLNISFETNDEIGQLARSFHKLVQKFNNLSVVADAIGKGDYTKDVEISGDKDVLGNAISRMKQNLNFFTIENDRKSWMLTGNAQLNDIMRGEKNLESLSGFIIDHLTHYIGAQAGALYLVNNAYQLEFMSGYGFDKPRMEMRPFKQGEGLIGQVAIDKKLLKIDNIKPEFLKIKTALADVTPVNIVILPFVYNNEVIGVAEIASKNEIEEEHIQYLESVSENIAVVISNLKSVIKTEELLYETQNQAEELETQQEELRQINMELNAQKAKLQTSEEELKASQEELQEKNAELEEKAHQLEEQYETLNLRNKELENARNAVNLKIEQLEVISKYKSEFLANMSHELRTPLNSILILARLIAENKDKNLTPKQVEFAEVIHNSGNDLLKLINEILDLSKIESGKVSLDPEYISVKEFLNKQNQYKELAKQKKIKFELLEDGDLPEKVFTDEFRLEQVLKNLLSNAFKFTPAGGSIRLRIFRPSADQRFRSEPLSQIERVIGFEVSDTGIGIPLEKQHVIFEAFQQADSSTTRKYGGTGLGLSISRELANLLGGEIQLSSDPGKGSSFTLYIPEVYEDLVLKKIELPTSVEKIEEAKPSFLELVKSIGKPLKGTEESSSQQPVEKRILIIEDDKGFSKILAEFAEKRNFKVFCTKYGKEGVKMAKEYRPDAILLDFNLPDINGMEVLRHIKEDPSIKHLPVHLMSAYDQEKLGDGYESFLPKPVTLESLDKIFNSINEAIENPIQKVLIVEDNKIENSALKELLISHDLHSDSAFSGKEAFEILYKKDFDCIILDLNLPDMEGFDIVENLSKDNKLKDIPVIIYSGRDITQQEEFRLKKHAGAIILKTEFSYTRLLEEVKLFLHKVQERLPKVKLENPKIYRAEEVLKNKKLLIVDDDVRNIYSLVNVFEEQDMDIVVANDGKEALRKLEHHPDIDIILMDIMMPEMDGIECTRLIRAQPKFKSVPLIALTAKAMKGDREKCLAAGASDYISKPVDVDKLLSLMRVWLYEARVF
jgi:CheY-like chemotaxis protein/signal transduction histidine kinase/HAMP domain-containing protein/CHASE3 domain sensor protein